MQLTFMIPALLTAVANEAVHSFFSLIKDRKMNLSKIVRMLFFLSKLRVFFAVLADFHARTTLKLKRKKKRNE